MLHVSPPAFIAPDVLSLLVHAANALSVRGDFPFAAEAAVDCLDDVDDTLLPETVRRALAAVAEAGAPRGGRTSRKRRVAAVEAALGRLEAAIDVALSAAPEDGDLHLAARNLAALADMLGIGEAGARLLSAALACRAFRPLDRLADRLVERAPSPGAAVACLLGLPRREGERLLEVDGPLARSGLAAIDRGGMGFTDVVEPLERLRAIVAREHEGPEALRLALLGPALSTPLGPDDYPHLSADLAFAARVLAGAARDGAAGVNILLHGPVGTGKTEFAKLIARLAGLTLHAVGEADAFGDEPNRRERLAEFRLGQRLLSLGEGGVLLFDEAEDLFVQGFGAFRGAAGSKVFLNRLFEGAPRPTVWIVNELDALPEAIRRRMTLAIRMGLPPASVRARLVSGLAAANGIDLPPGAADRFGREWVVPPALAACAVRAARLSGGGAADAERAIGGLVEAVGPATARRFRDAAPVRGERFDLAAADVDLTALADRLVASGERRFSLLLSGPPGTGKSAFARHLADRLDLPLVLVRASSVLSPYVGESEQAIARAFREAEAAGAFLLLDEVDGLLCDRSSAVRGFELTQVNELLSAIEHHPLPFAATTNLSGRLDPASARRFTFKVTFRFLPPESARALFRQVFDRDPPATLHRLATLVPADFALVARKARILGALDDPSHLAELLAEECAGRREAAAPIGFVGRRTRTATKMNGKEKKA